MKSPFRDRDPDSADPHGLCKDVTDVLYFMYKKRPESGLYNLGTGKARSFLDLTKATFQAMSLEPVIEFTDTPADIRDKYQYFTEAPMEKLRATAYGKPFFSLEEGIQDYVRNYLMENKYN